MTCFALFHSYPPYRCRRVESKRVTLCIHVTTILTSTSYTCVLNIFDTRQSVLEEHLGYTSLHMYNYVFITNPVPIKLYHALTIFFNNLLSLTFLWYILCLVISCNGNSSHHASWMLFVWSVLSLISAEVVSTCKVAWPD